MPKAVIPKGADARMYRTLSFGPLASFIVLDGRQYRSDQPCGDGNKPSTCPGFFEDRTMLGSAQEKWVDTEMRASRAQWNVLANQVAMTMSIRVPPGRQTHTTWMRGQVMKPHSDG